MSQGFFDVHAKLAARLAAPVTVKPVASPKPISVSQLTAQIDRVIKGGFPLSLLVQGEISNYPQQRGSAHCYFTLKDATACIDCVIWKSDLPRIKFEPTDGMELIASGRLAVYAQKGKYQL